MSSLDAAEAVQIVMRRLELFPERERAILLDAFEGMLAWLPDDPPPGKPSPVPYLELVA